MQLSEIKTPSDLEAFLRELINWNGERVTYDFGLIVRLLLASLENLKTYGLEAEFEDIGYYLTDEQRQFLAKSPVMRTI